MGYLKCQFVFAFVLFLTILHQGSSLDCYECSDIRNPECADPFIPNDMLLRPCGFGQVCIKQTTLPMTHIAQSTNRQCASMDYCDTVWGISDFCEICTTSYCNSSSTILPPFIISVTLAALFVAKNYVL